MVPNLVSYELQYGESHDPGAFSPPVAGPYGGVVDQRGRLRSGTRPACPTVRTRCACWHATPGGSQYESRVRLFVIPPYVEPTPTPVFVEPTPTWTPLPLPTDTPFVEPTWTPAPIPTAEIPVVPPVEVTATWTPEFVLPITDTYVITDAALLPPVETPDASP